MTNSRFGKSVLIVDYKLDELSGLRNIVSGLGFEKIEAASSVNMAMSYLREESFDLVLIAYDLGKTEKNGLQVIQEVYAEKLRLFQTLFLLIVDAGPSSLLVGSLESAPNAYISRPYERAKIQNLLEKLLRVKKAVVRVDESMDSGDWNRALEYCTRLIDIYPGLKVYLERLQGICLLESERYRDAEVLFAGLVTSRKQVWAQVGQGMAYYFMGYHSKAVDVLQQVVDQQHISVEAYTWLARSLQVLGNLSQSVLLMRKAVMLQPSVPQLQSEMGNMAAYAEDWVLAVDAFRAVIKYSRYSVFQNPDHYFALVRCLIARYQIKKENLAEFELEAIRAMEDVIRDFVSDISVQFRAHLVIAELREVLGNTVLAQAELKQALGLFEQLPVDEQWRWLDWIVDASEGKVIAEPVKTLKSQLLHNEHPEPWVVLMKSGLQQYQKGELETACESFRQADFAQAESVAVVLNLAQATLELKAKDSSELSMRHWVDCLVRLNRLNYGAFSLKQQKRYKTLMQRYSAIQIQTDTG
ncbi:response regulator [Neptunomonas antarctica]|uniref:Response regulator receiver domain-containing protein n=1 Tax=Neptunomonas antarctica TaxID=619304 RepID=A0A1N7M2A6_9GAMM|nr:response regulator [Neptunomonas antarctica]SIS80183.1 Response regulator receiver domain-containing protein [Neptunomonas antarctica]